MAQGSGGAIVPWLKTAPQRRGGHECEFVEQPPKVLQSECPICLFILRDPYQVTCCGYSYCESCIERVQATRTNCPTCNEGGYSAFPDKRLRRALYEYKVRCTHHQNGCQWVGELNHLERHLNASPDFSKQLEGCQFVEVECIHCGEPFQRCHVKAHQNDRCTRRPYGCTYCEDYGADYEDVVNKHWPVCPCYPVPCPNKCGTTPRRQNLEQHVTKECLIALVDCDFNHTGCNARLLRIDMPAHLMQNLVAHTSLLAAHSLRMSAKMTEKEEEITMLRKELETQGKKIKELEKGNQTLVALLEKNKGSQGAVKVGLEVDEPRRKPLKQEADDCNGQPQAEATSLAMERKNWGLEQSPQLKQEKKHSPLHVRMLNSMPESTVPVRFTMMGFEKCKRDDNHWFSLPFYSHECGYRLCLRVDANGDGKGRGTHVTVAICLMKGQCDDFLKWPFRGRITIHLLNQLDDSEHHAKILGYHDHVSDETAGRVTHGERGKGKGKHRFVSHAELNHNPAKNCQYLKDDCLCFQVKKVSLY